MTPEPSSECATAELHYTDLGSGEAFDEVRRRHGLKRVCSSHTPGATRRHAWASPDTGVVLSTDCDPSRPTYEKGAQREAGYCSYTTIHGSPLAAESLYRDVVETATYIKGEFEPLATGDGRVLVTLEAARTDNDVERDDAVDFETLFSWLRPPARRPAYPHVPVSIPGSDAETLRESAYDEIVELPAGATYGSGTTSAGGEV